jgi:mRNA interferase YafQ
MNLSAKNNNKRTNLPLESEYTKQFLKDWQRLTQTGRFNMQKLKQVMLLLIDNSEPLPAQWLDHALKGEWLGARECHIGGDFLLIYKINIQKIVFYRLGTHSELFK